MPRSLIVAIDSKATPRLAELQSVRVVNKIQNV